MSPKIYFDGSHTVTFQHGIDRPSVGVEALSDKSLAILSGCTANGATHCMIDDDGNFEMVIQGPYISHKNTVCIKRDTSGLYLYLDYIRFEDNAPSGLGTMMLSRMAHEAKRLGLTHISLLAAGGTNLKYDWGENDFSGYYVWARLGFDAALKPVMQELVDCDPQLSGSIRVSDIMTRNRDWWRTNGSGDYMEFDLSDGSLSWNTLNDILTQRGW